MRRWFARLTLALIALVTLMAAGVQVALWTDLPRHIVVNAVEKRTGLRVEVAALETGWRGQTTLKGVEARLPLEDEPLVRIPRLDVRHAPLPKILLLRGVGVTSATAQGPRLRLAQDERGRWNGVEALELIRDALSAGASARSAVAPRLQLEHIDVSVERFGAEPVQLAPLDIRAVPASSRTLDVSARLGSTLRLEGRLETGSAWSHRISFRGDELDRLAAAFIDTGLPSPLSASGRWTGRVSGPDLTGALELTDARAGQVTAAGRVDLAARANSVVARDLSARIEWPEGPVASVDVEGASLSMRGAAIEADDMRVATEGVVAMLHGRWDRSTHVGEVAATWTGTDDSIDLEHHGSLTVSAEAPPVGVRSARVGVRGGGRVPGGAFEIELTALGEGASWSELAGELTATTLSWRDEDRAIDANGLTARWDSQWPRITLLGLDVPGATVEAHGHVDVDARRWAIDVDSVGPVAIGEIGGSMSIEIEARGDDVSAEIARIAMTSDRLDVEAGGTYDTRSTPSFVGEAVIVARVEMASSAPGADADAAGTLTPIRLVTSVTGRPRPLELELDGTVFAADLPVAAGRITDLELPLSARITRERITYRCPEAALLGGAVAVSGALDPSSRRTEMQIEARGLALASLDQLIAAALPAGGTVSLDAHVVIPELDASRMEVDGEWRLEDVRGLGISVERGQGRVRRDGDGIALREVVLASGNGSIEGTADVDPGSDRVRIEATARDWPVTIEGVDASAVLSGDVDIDVDVADAERSATGDVRLAGPVTIRERVVGNVSAQAELIGRTVEVNAFEVGVLGGTVLGNAKVPIDDWMAGRGEATWERIDLGELRAHIPQLEGLRGVVSGSAVVKSSTEPRAPGPIVLHATVDADDGGFQEIEFDQAVFIGYAGNGRIIVEQISAAIAGGALELWGRISTHGDEQFCFVDGDFTNLRLDQLARVVTTVDGEVPGYVTGTLSAGGYVKAPHRMFGRAEALLSESDIAGIPLISTLYDTLNLKIGAPRPEGEGRARFRLEGEALELSRLNYFNRGTDVVARVRLENVWAGKSSPISGVAAGAVRPLKHIDLPLLRDVDSLMGALQTNSGFARIGGTVGEPEITPAPFVEVSKALEAILSK